MQEILKFKNTQNENLIGILHIPNNINSNKKKVVVFLNSGLIDKVGPHRLYLKIAKKIANDGYFSFRFDAHGLGDSEGEMIFGSNIENFIAIQNGTHVIDVISAIKFLSQYMKPEKILLLGLCGGGVTAMLSTRDCALIDGLILIDPPVYLEYPNKKNSSAENPLKGKLILDKLFKKKCDFKSHTLQTIIKKNYAAIIKSLLSYFKYRIWHLHNDSIGKPINSKFIGSFLHYTNNNKPILFVLGEKDLTAKEFELKFEKKYFKKNNDNSVKIIKCANANHEFHSLESQELLLKEISTWLQNRFSD